MMLKICLFLLIIFNNYWLEMMDQIPTRGYKLFIVRSDLISPTVQKISEQQNTLPQQQDSAARRNKCTDIIAKTPFFDKLLTGYIHHLEIYRGWFRSCIYEYFHCLKSRLCQLLHQYTLTYFCRNNVRTHILQQQICSFQNTKNAGQLVFKESLMLCANRLPEKTYLSLI